MGKDSPPDGAKTERFNMFMSPEESQAIDDWAWEKRIRSKSEAVRRLCRIGLDMNETIPPLTDRIEDVLSSARLLFHFALSSAEKQKSGATVDIEQLVGRAEDMLNRVDDVFLMALRENNRIIPLAERKGIRKAFAEADVSDEAVNRLMELYIEKGDEVREAHLIRQVREELTPEERARYESLPPKQQGSFWMSKLVDKRREIAAYDETAKK